MKKEFCKIANHNYTTIEKGGEYIRILCTKCGHHIIKGFDNPKIGQKSKKK